MAVALFLQSHSAVERVLYPGLPSHPQHDLAKIQQHGYGAMVSFSCVGGRAQAAAFLQNVSLHPCCSRSTFCSALLYSGTDDFTDLAPSFLFSRISGCCGVVGRESIVDDSCFRP